MIQKPPKQVFIRPGKTFHFHCQATSTRHVRYSWTKNDIELKRSERVQWSEDIPGLVVKDVVEEDNGKYTCNAFAGGKLKSDPVEDSIASTVFEVNSKSKNTRRERGPEHL